MTAGDLLNATLEALARADATGLEQLAEAAGGAEFPETEGERQAVLRQHRALGRLLQLVRRNLWLLRGAYREAYGYVAPGDERDGHDQYRL